MKDMLETLRQWRDAGETFALATVINVDGSAPRDEGATMLIAASGKIAGSVSGGCVEGAVVDEAQSVLAGGAPKIVRYGINKTMMWDVGLSCGGAIDVFIERFTNDAQPGDFTRPVAVCTIVRGPDRVGLKRAVYAQGPSTGSTGDRALDSRIDELGSSALARGNCAGCSASMSGPRRSRWRRPGGCCWRNT